MIQIVDPSLWTPLAVEEDPFLSMRPDNRPCAATEWGLEETLSPATDDGGEPVDPAFELHTEVCNYLTVTQPLRSAIRIGDRVQALVWHTQLTGEAAEGYVAIGFGGTVVWDARVTLPARQAGTLPVAWIANQDLPVDTAVWFHVQNHGQNTWKLAEFVAHRSSTSE